MVQLLKKMCNQFFEFEGYNFGDKINDFINSDKFIQQWNLV